MPVPIQTLGELRQRATARARPVKQEVRDNLMRKLQAGETLFPGIIGYEDTVIPQLVNAILSRHNFILLGLRGQAKSRILRGLVDLLDEQIPVVPGCEIHDDPLAPVCGACRARVAKEGARTLPGFEVIGVVAALGAALVAAYLIGLRNLVPGRPGASALAIVAATGATVLAAAFGTVVLGPLLWRRLSRATAPVCVGLVLVAAAAFAIA
jgi:hypothetical protein